MSDKKPSKEKEIIIQGIPASPGVAMGSAYLFHRTSPDINTDRLDEERIPDQLTFFRTAKESLQDQWQQLREKEKNKQSKAILSAQIEIIADPDLSAQIELYIKDERYAAQHAIGKAFKKYIDRFSRAGSSMMTDRMIDLSDIRDRLVEAAGAKGVSSISKKGDILVSKEISPREVIQLSHESIKGFVMEQGGNTSHAAIIARSMGIPAVVGAKGVMEAVTNGDTLCLDGEQGLVSVNPSAHTRKRVEQLRADTSWSIKDQIATCGKTSKTADGTPFTIRANVEFSEELKNVRQFRAEGIGLLRTESVYLNREEFGSAENQAAFYDQMLSRTDEQPVVIRLFDVGGDKFQGTKISEGNPFLGWRGIRMLLDQREILREQLKAILTVAGKHPGRVKLLVPMVSTLNEVKEVRAEITRCRKELLKEGKAVDENIELGIMVEIPSVAIQADHFASVIDFFSIGTNDLTQYLLAVDRGNALISRLYNQAHPAVWKLINYVIKVAKDNEIKVDVCGELAANPVAAACLLGMGISSLSMSPVRIPAVKQQLLRSTHIDMEELAKEVQQCMSTTEVETLFNNWKNRT